MVRVLKDVWSSVERVILGGAAGRASGASLEHPAPPADLAGSEEICEEGLQVVCAFCNKLRSKNGGWVKPDSAELERNKTVLSHGMCPSCFRSRFPEDYATLSYAEGFAKGLPLVR